MLAAQCTRGIAVLSFFVGRAIVLISRKDFKARSNLPIDANDNRHDVDPYQISRDPGQSESVPERAYRKRTKCALRQICATFVHKGQRRIKARDYQVERKDRIAIAVETVIVATASLTGDDL